jgi:hypothetical protein
MGEAAIDISDLSPDEATEYDVDLQKYSNKTNFAYSRRTGKGKLHFILTYAEHKISDKVIKSGYLDKRGKFKNMWQTRFFVLNSDGLYWYSNNTVTNGRALVSHINVSFHKH